MFVGLACQACIKITSFSMSSAWLPRLLTHHHRSTSACHAFCLPDSTQGKASKVFYCATLLRYMRDAYQPLLLPVADVEVADI